MTYHMNRRIFLRGLGGACVAAPFLSSVQDRSAKAQAAGTPKRLIAMFTHYGCITTRFFPKKANGALAAADLTGTTLEPLSPYVSKLLIPRGIRSMNEWTSAMNRGQGNDPHTQVCGSYFTCYPVTPNTDNPFDLNNTAAKFNAKPTGPSLDHVIATQLSKGGTPLFMRVGNINDSPQSAISYSASTTAYPGLGVPSQVFSSLTGLYTAGTPMNADTYAVSKGKTVMDVVKDDLETLKRVDMSSSDKMKLDAWEALLSDTTSVMASAQCNEATATMLGLSTANVNAVKGGGMGSDILTTKVNSTTMDGADIYSNLAVLAAVCNANPVIFMKYPGSYVFSGLGLTGDAHGLSHRIGNAGMTGSCVNGVLDMLGKIDDFYAAKFAYLVKQLDSINEGDGTVLDNSAAIWFQEMSDGNAHNLNNAPIVQAGGLAGYFKTGMAVNLDDGKDTLSSGASESLCADGTSTQVNGATQSTGTDPKIANAPINKYFVNLMNALGVKAGADGFPAKDGTAEVSKFGMYDNTADFIHGGTNPAKINSPGGFDALKAG